MSLLFQFLLLVLVFRPLVNVALAGADAQRWWVVPALATLVLELRSWDGIVLFLPQRPAVEGAELLLVGLEEAHLGGVDFDVTIFYFFVLLGWTLICILRISSSAWEKIGERPPSWDYGALICPPDDVGAGSLVATCEVAGACLMWLQNGLSWRSRIDNFWRQLLILNVYV